MNKITWTNETRKTADLVPADYNPRTMSKKEREDLEESIRRYGAVVPVVVNVGKRKDVLIGGHQRVTSYADLGIEEIDVRVPSRELSDEEERELNLRLNKNVGHDDFAKLAEMGIELLVEVGYGDEELAMLWDDVDILDDAFNAEARAKKITDPITAPGDIWELGDHRLMVGDAGSEEDLHALLGKEEAHLAHVDPYRDPGLKKAEYSNLVGAAIANGVIGTRDDAHFLIWCDENEIGDVQKQLKNLKANPERVCMRIMRSAVSSPKVAFSKAYEPCVYATIGKPYLNQDLKNLSEILNREVEPGNQTMDDILAIINIWLETGKVQDANDHKPISLYERPLKRLTAPGHIVLDLFGRGGPMLMACEQIKRKARVMERDPVMATVIIQRWEEYTGRKAKQI